MNTIERRCGPIYPTHPRTLLLFAGLLLELPLMSACPKVCADDGFAWQQDPNCLAQMSLTDGTTDTVTATDATDATDPTGEATSVGGSTWCVDADKDGFGDPQSCTQVPPEDAPPPGTVDNDDDCNDDDAFTFPGAAPNDDAAACMKDADDDDWGDAVPPGDGGGGAVPGTDCNDSDAFTFPGAAPNDDPVACMKDADDDDWGDANPPGGMGSGVVAGTDCDDENMNAWASCDGCNDDDGDGWLSNCDSYPPEHPAPDCDDADMQTFPGAAPKDDAQACMTDADGDDWGDDSPSAPGAVPGTDCDDQSAKTFPGAASADDANACMEDEDGDGHGEARPMKPGVVPGSDCFDANPNLNPASAVLVTAPLTSGDILKVDIASGAVDPYAKVDVAGINPWIPTSLAVNPVDGSVYAALAFNDRLATMNYCGAGKPTLLAAPHKKNICGIGFDRAGQLYGIDGQVDQLLVLNPDDGSLLQAKPLTFNGKTLNVADCGMAYDCHEDRLLVSDSGSGGIYVVNIDGTTTQIADLPGEDFGAGLEYDPKTRLALSCNQTSFLSIAVDGSSDFTQLPDLEEPADDLTYGPKCQ